MPQTSSFDPLHLNNYSVFEKKILHQLSTSNGNLKKTFTGHVCVCEVNVVSWNKKVLNSVSDSC